MDEVATVDKRDSDEPATRWLKEIELSTKDEKAWRSDARKALKVYRSDADSQGSRKETFNILWANTETQRMNLYNSAPRADIRRRNRDNDPLGKAISELTERATGFFLDGDEFHNAMVAATLDTLLPGRAITRVRYEATIDGEEVDDDGEITAEGVVGKQHVNYEQVQWDSFRRGPGKRWADVPWLAFEHLLFREQMEDKFPKFVDEVAYDVGEADKDAVTDKTVFKRCRVWEIWDKDEKNIKWLAPSYKDSLLGTDEPAVEFEGFFDVPMPLYAVESATSLIPVTEYSMYQTLAEELEKVTNRINLIVSALRVRGIYDSTLTEVSKLFDSAENSMIPTEDTARFIEQGGFDKAIWMLPIDVMATVLNQLYQTRQQLMAQIYEATGISDIMRGNTDPNETLGAQEIKANFGTGRLQRKQSAVARYARDLLRMTTEIVSEQFSPETLTKLTGLKFPTAQEKQVAIQQLQMVQQMPQQEGMPPPQMEQQQKIAATPSWDEIMEVLHDDLSRAYRIDIETDSTIQANQQKDQQTIANLMQAMGNFIEGFAPAVESGVMSVEAGKTLMMSIVRRFKLGREVEDALEEGADQQQGPSKEDQAAQAQQMQMQADQQSKDKEMAATAATAQAAGQLKQAEMQMKGQIESQRMQLDSQNAQAKLALEAEDKRELRRLKELELTIKSNELALDERKRVDDREKWEAEVFVKNKAVDQKPVKEWNGGKLHAVG